MDLARRFLFALPDGIDEDLPTVKTEGRLVVVELTDTAAEIAQRHKCTDGAALLMGEASVGLGLMGAMIKGEERLSLQVVAAGPIGRIMVEETGEGRLRGFPRAPEAVVASASVRGRAAQLLGSSGEIHVIRSVEGQVIYQGSSPLLRAGLESSFEAYLYQSEQLPSFLSIAVEVTEAGEITLARGLMLQALGGGDRPRFRRFVDAVDRGRLRGALYKWDGGDLQPLLDRLPPMLGLEPAAELPLSFGCRCSRDRAAGMLIGLGADDLAALKEEQGEGEIDCAFCRQVYRFSPHEMDLLIESARLTQGQS